MTARPKSIDMEPGTKLRDVTEDDERIVTLDRRKVESEHDAALGPFLPGWWNTDGTGLADFVLDDDASPWDVVDG